MRNFIWLGNLVGIFILVNTSIAMAMDTKNWVVVPGESKVSFGSIKKNVVGEVHHFSGISGTVSGEGKVNINIETKSLETNIDIRNERMLKWVFDAAFPMVTLTSKLDMKELNALNIGQTTTTDLEGVVSINSKNVDIETELFVARISKDRVLVTTDSMIMVSTKDFGIDEGVTKLMEVAKLPGITRAVPVTLRILFKSNNYQASIKSNENKEASTQKIALTGDIKKGKKVFKKCSACHNVKKEKNKVGPHLVKIIGRKFASVEGYSYSKAIKQIDRNWGVEELTAYLKKPKAYIPGTKMIFKGLKKPKDIENLIAYIDSVGRS